MIWDWNFNATSKLKLTAIKYSNSWKTTTKIMLKKRWTISTSPACIHEQNHRHLTQVSLLLVIYSVLQSIVKALFLRHCHLLVCTVPYARMWPCPSRLACHLHYPIQSQLRWAAHMPDQRLPSCPRDCYTVTVRKALPQRLKDMLQRHSKNIPESFWNQSWHMGANRWGSSQMVLCHSQKLHEVRDQQDCHIRATKAG